MISPNYIQNIKERPEFEELRKHLAEETLKINNISDLKEVPWIELGDRVKARLEAYKILQKILEPLIDLPELQTKKEEDEFAV